ncbi:MAG TPA: tRNA 2-thiouridine(34) synthase MnmA [Solirubrobacteraceae bacterium]|nr:tRNA 2-thiouridine(34) synthase MnmA [Solirubrobacteraceae bacterium]
MDERFEDHLRHPRGHGLDPAGAHHGAAGGAPCGDLVRIALRVDGDRVAEAGFEASGCGAAVAAASAAVELAGGASILDAARIGPAEVAAELGGLSPGKLHAADLAADALAVALGKAAAADAEPRDSADRVLVAMSGGVDSAVAALLCARSGADVVAVTVELWRDAENDAERSCCSASAVRAARAVAHRLGLPHLTLDVRDAFRAGVVDPYLADHAAGLTPNPCIRCNGGVRLDAMLALGDRIGARSLATGHYARVGADGLLRPAADEAKDQTYMLAGIAPATLARLHFPVGELRKPQVRALAEEAGIAVARRPDSQDLCFLAGTGRAAFLARHGGVRDRPGPIVDAAGRQLGRHRGHHHFTVGQRRGLGVGGGTGEPLYVLATDPRANTVTVGPRDALATARVPVRGVRLHRAEDDVARVKLRYRSRAVGCRLNGDEVELLEPFAGAAPGQTAVFLGADDAVIGVGTIAAPA